MQEMKDAAVFEFEGKYIRGIMRNVTAREIDDIAEIRDENGKFRWRKTSPVLDKIVAEVIFPSGTVLPIGSSFSMPYGGRARLWLVIRAVTTKVNGEFIQIAVTAVARELACFVWGMMTDHIRNDAA